MREYRSVRYGKKDAIRAFVHVPTGFQFRAHICLSQHLPHNVIVGE